jgi:hypothetical protein
MNTCDPYPFYDSYCVIGSINYCAICAGPTYTNHNCVPCPKYCGSCSAPNNCTTCSPGYMKPLNSNICVNITNYAMANLSVPVYWVSNNAILISCSLFYLFIMFFAIIFE